MARSVSSSLFEGASIISSSLFERGFTSVISSRCLPFSHSSSTTFCISSSQPSGTMTQPFRSKVSRTHCWNSMNSSLPASSVAWTLSTISRFASTSSCVYRKSAAVLVPLLIDAPVKGVVVEGNHVVVLPLLRQDPGDVLQGHLHPFDLCSLGATGAASLCRLIGRSCSSSSSGRLSSLAAIRTLRLPLRTGQNLLFRLLPGRA